MDIEAHVLDELKRRRRRQGKTLGQLASELLAGALVDTPSAARPLRWNAGDLGARVDLSDKEALTRALDEG